MADKILHKRSYTPGSKPTISNLDALGEIAINVDDGKAFLHKSGSGIDTIEEFVITNATNTGSITLSGSVYITGSVDTLILTASGLNYPAADNGEESFIQTDGNGNLSLQYVKTIYEEIYNGETVNIIKGTPVYVSGSNGAASKVFIADAGNPAKMPVIYISADTIAPGETGRGIALGLIKGVDTTGYPGGTEIFIAVGGGWTSIRPTGSAIVQILGYVTKEGSGGQGVILNPGPASLPNITSGSIWVGNNDSVPIIIPTSSIKNVISSSYAATASSADGFIIRADNFEFTGSINTTGSIILTGSLSVSGSITGSLFGTSSWAISASQATTASYALNSAGGSGFPFNGDALITGSLLVSGSGVRITGSLSVSGSITGSLFGTASWAQSASVAISSSYALSSSNAATASSADNFTVRGTLTAQTIVVQTITASIEFLTGSTKFGDAANDTHQFTGSVGISGSLTVVGPTVASGSFTGSFLGSYSGSYTGSYTGSLTGSLLGTASWAQSASRTTSASYADNSNLLDGLDSTVFVLTGSFNSYTASINSFSASILSYTSSLNAKTSSFATTGSNSFNGNQTITGSVMMSGSAGIELTVRGDQVNTGSLRVTGSVGITGSLNVLGAVSASSFTGSFRGLYTGSFTGSYTGSLTGSLLGTASWAQSASVIASTGTNAFIQGGNTFGAAALLGTNDNYSLGIETNGSTRLFISGSEIIDYPIQYLGYTTSSTTTITLPSTPQLLEGDLVIVTSFHNNVNLTGSIPVGYTSSQSGSINSVGYMWAYKFMGSTPDTTATNITGSTLAFAFRYVNRSTPINVSAPIATNTTGMPNPPSITTTVSGSLIVALGFLDKDRTTPTASAGYTLIGYVSSSATTNSGSIMASYTVQSTPGLVDPGVFTGSGTFQSDNWVAATFALTPITSSGNIGINNTTPLTTLHIGTPISGDINLTNKAPVRISTPNFNTSSSINEALFIDHRHEDFTSGSGTAIVMGYKNPLYGSYVSRIINYTNVYNNTGTRLQLQTQTAGINNTWNTGILINENGNVGVGTTSPNARLTVAGNGTGTALIGDLYGSGNYTGISLNGTSSSTTYNLLSGTGDQNLYINRPAGYDMYFRAGNASQVIIDSAGDVGIGTTSPTYKLVISNAGANGLEIDPGTVISNRNLLINFNRSTSAYTDIQIDAATTILGIRGNVGIGTESPVSKLEVSGSNGALLRLRASGIGNNYILYNSGSTDLGYIGYGSAANNSMAFINYQNQPVLIGTNNVVIMTITGSNVGINTATPYERLEVNGAISATGISTNLTAQGHATTLSVNGGSSYLQAVDWGAEFKPLVIDGKTISLQTGVGSTTSRLYIDNTGSIGMGITTPASKLDIVGGSISVGTNSATEGTILLQDQYSLGHLTNIGTNRSSGGPVIGYAVYPSVNTTNTFSSSVNNVVAFERSAFSMDGSFRWYTGAAQTLNLGASASLSQKMILDNNGNLGINNTSPSYRLDITGDARVNTGALGINVTPNATDGRIDASNDIVAYSSDKRLKTNIQFIENPLGKINKLTGFIYNWNEKAKELANYNTEESLVGVFAQDVQAVLPEAVKLAPFDNDGNNNSISGENYLTVQYEKIVPLLIEAIKEQQKQIDELKYLLQNKQ